MQTLRDAGITHLLDLREPHELSAPHFGQGAVDAMENAGIVRLHLPVVDMDAPENADFDAARRWIEDVLLDPNAKIYLHCRAGMERTAAIACALEAKRAEISFDEALAKLKLKRPIFQPLPAQRTAARAWLGE